MTEVYTSYLVSISASHMALSVICPRVIKALRKWSDVEIAGGPGRGPPRTQSEGWGQTRGRLWGGYLDRLIPARALQATSHVPRPAAAAHTSVRGSEDGCESCDVRLDVSHVMWGWMWVAMWGWMWVMWCEAGCESWCEDGCESRCESCDVRTDVSHVMWGRMWGWMCPGGVVMWFDISQVMSQRMWVSDVGLDVSHVILGLMCSGGVGQIIWY